jgi:UDP-N-acetylglucosamine transferase subunit ALG13
MLRPDLLGTNSMIFVTVGNSHHRSLRLLQGVEELAASGFFGGERIIVQTGNNPEFSPTHCEARPFVGMDEFTALVREAGLVICHAGAGTLSSVLRSGKTPVVVPRRLKYNEIVDDHQTELLEAFAARKLLVPAYEVADLPDAIREARSRAAVSVQSADVALAKIGHAVNELLDRP